MNYLNIKNIYLKSSSIYDLLIHIGIVICLFSIILMYFFNSYLLNFTFHGETVSVPDLVGMNMSEVEEFLSKRDLDFVISDSTYSESHKPNVVLTQSPAPGDIVKRNRKIRITINPTNPPKIKMPYIIDMPFSEARRTLNNADLKLGQVAYKPHIAENVILELKINGKTYTPKDKSIFEEGSLLITKGTVVHILVGDGVGKDEFPVPDLVGLSQDEAELLLKGSELILGTVQYNFKSSQEIGTVLRQNPRPYLGTIKPGVEAGSVMDDRERAMIRAGEVVDLWVAGNPAARPEDAEEELSEEEIRRRDSLDQNINIRNAEEFDRYRKKKLGTEEKKPTKKPENPKPENNNQ